MTTTEKNSEFEFIQGLTEELSTPLLIFPTSLKAIMSIRHAITQGNLPNDSLARIISTEPVLAAQILKMSNGEAYNSTGKINNELCAATMKLGFINVRNLAISIGMKQLTEHKEVNIDIAQLMEGLWNRSLRVAVMSREVAKKMTRVNPANAFLAGLLHDVGKFYILNRAKHYQSLFHSQQELWSVVDSWHSNIGAAILENWEVCDEIRNAVQDFGNPTYVYHGAVNLSDVLVVADMLDAHFDPNSKRKLNWEKVPPVLAHLACDVQKSEELRESAKVEFDLLLSSIR